MAAPAHIARENGKKGGRPRGRKNNATLEKEAVKEWYKQKVLQAAESLFISQLHLSVGQTFLYKIEKEKVKGPRGGVSYKAKKPVLVTDPVEIEKYLMGLTDDADIDQGPEATYYYLTTKEPNPRAIDSMLDRTLDKATQPIAGDKDNPLEVNVNQITIKGYNKKPAKKNKK